MAKSYWQSASVTGPRSQEAIKSWFGELADDMIAYKAEILCDFKTDREKKIRAFMTDPEGRNYRFERTLGRKTFSITRKLVSSTEQTAKDI